MTLYDVEIEWRDTTLTRLSDHSLNGARAAARRLSLCADIVSVAVIWPSGREQLYVSGGPVRITSLA